MEKLNELNEAIKNVIEIANSINDDVTKEIFEKAPLVIHQRFCSELVEICKKNLNKIPSEIPEAVEILNAISVIKRCYPKIDEHYNK